MSRRAAGPSAREEARAPSGAPGSERSGLALVALAAVLWGLLGPIARIAFREGVEPLELGFWRAALAGGACLVLTVSRRRRPVAPRDLPAVIAFGVVAVALFYASYFLAVERAGAAVAAILLYTAPAWVAIVSYFWLGERIGRRGALAVALTLTGVAAISMGGGSLAAPSASGVAWGLVAGLSYAVYYLAGQRYFGRYGTMTVLAYALPIGALALLPLVEFRPKSAIAWSVILFIALVPTFVAYLVYGAGLLRTTPTRAATIATIEPLVAAAAALALWDERFRAPGYLGGALVLAGVLIVVRRRPAIAARRALAP